MNEYIVAPGTVVIIVGVDEPWGGRFMRPTTTTRMNAFTEAEVILNPYTGECKHKAPKVDEIAPIYLKNQYFGFRRGKYCMIVKSDYVYVKEDEARENAA